MHEMSIVSGILQIAEDQALAAGAAVIRAIEVEVGELAGIEKDALVFCFEAARRGTLAAGAELVVHDIPGRGLCPDCGREVAVTTLMAVCPECDGALVQVTQGRELRVRSLTVD